MALATQRRGFPLIDRVRQREGNELELTISPDWLRAGSAEEHMLGALALYQMWMQPGRVIAAGEPVRPAFRDAVRSAWRCEVLDLYATTETGALAIDSPDGQGRYLLEDATIVEVVDAQERPVPDGAPPS